jgi:hypothetical protein
MLAIVPLAVVSLAIGWYLRLPKPIPASGIVTQCGHPLYGMEVSFVPVDQNGSAAYATTDPRGKFILEDGVSSSLGAVPGNYIVTVANSSNKKSWPMRQPIPESYTDKTTTPLTAEVTRDGPNFFTFDLTMP